MLLEGNSVGDALEQDMMMLTTLAQGLPLPDESLLPPPLLLPSSPLPELLPPLPPPPCTHSCRQDAGSEDSQQPFGSRLISGQVPLVAGKPLQNCSAQLADEG